MNRYPRTVLKLLVAAIAVLAFPAAALSVGQSSSRQPVTAQGGRRRRHDQRPDAARAQGSERPLVRDRQAERVQAAGLQAEGHPRDRQQGRGTGEAKAGQRHEGGREHHARLVQDRGPGPSERPHGLGEGEGCRDSPDALAGRRLPRLARAPALEGRASSSTRTGLRSAHRAWRRLSGSSTSPSASSRSRSRSWAHSPSRRAPTRSCRTGPVGESSASTAGPTRRCSARPCPTAASGSRTITAAFLRDRIPVGTPIRVVAT